MARVKMDIKCEECGETFVHIAFKRNRSEADEYESWAAQNITVCPECFRKAREAKQAERAAEVVGDYQLPELTGSVKQVAWAEKIRVRMIDDNFCGYAQDNYDLDAIKAATRETIREEIAKEGLDEWGKQFTWFIWGIWHETSASWFIDHRDVRY